MADHTDHDSLLLALRDARPETSSETFTPTSQHGRALLNALLTPPAPESVNMAARRRHTRPTRQTPRRLAMALGATAGMTAAIVGGLTFLAATPSGRQPQSAAPSTRTATAPAPTLRLAGYSFALPRGYTVTAKSCGKSFTPPVGTTTVAVSPPPVVGGDTYAQAASASGGCIEAALGTGHPASARAVQVGSYSGFLWRTDSPLRGPLLTLYVLLPPSASARVGMDPGLNLILNSTDLTPAQLEQIAESGLGE